MMNVRAVTFDQLTSDEIAAWSEIQRAEPSLDSPYFRPEFTQAVAAVRDDVEVAILEECGIPIGFFPYQRTRRNIAQPVGGKLSDFHGLIAPARLAFDPLELIRGCGLSAWQFNHLLPEQASFAPFIWREVDAPFIDLREDLDHYLARKENGRRLMSEYLKKSQKLTRKYGSLRFVTNVADREVFSTLVAWKSDHYRRTNMPNVFDFPWVPTLLKTLGKYDGDDFCRLISVLYAGDTIAAITLAMRSYGVLHSWFPTYNVDLAVYSPGFLHWIETMRAAPSLGIRRIDLGAGSERYKGRLMNGASRVASGAVDLQSARAIAHRALWTTREHVRASRLAVPARVPARIFRHLRHWFELRSFRTDKNA